jgi:starch synthase
MRFTFFSKAALEFLLKSNKRPDVLHCHDWQTDLVPVMLYEMYQYHGMWNQRACYTIHNFKHQGMAGNDILRATGLNRESYYFQYDRLQDNFNPFALNRQLTALLSCGKVTPKNFVSLLCKGWSTTIHGTILALITRRFITYPS